MQTAGRLASRLAGKDLTQWGGPVRQKRLAERDVQAPQLAVDGDHRCLQLSVLLRLREHAIAAAPRLQQGITDHPHHLRKGDDLLVAASAVPVEQLVQPLLIRDHPQQATRRLRQRQRRHKFRSLSRIHARHPCSALLSQHTLNHLATIANVAGCAKRRCQKQWSGDPRRTDPSGRGGIGRSREIDFNGRD